MSSNQKQEKKDFNLFISLSKFKSDVVHSVFSSTSQKPLVDPFNQGDSVSRSASLPGINCEVNRRSSTPPTSNLVGSNKYFISFLIPFSLYFFIDSSFQEKTDHSIHFPKKTLSSPLSQSSICNLIEINTDISWSQ